MEKGHAHQEDTLEDKLGFQKMYMWQRRPLVVLCVTASGLGTEAGGGWSIMSPSPPALSPCAAS